MVALSLRKPCCQKIIWSVLRCMDSFLGRPCDPSHHHTCDDESKQTNQEVSPVATRAKIESSHRKTCTQQRAAEKPQARIIGGEALLHRPPKTTEEKRTNQNARHQAYG